MRQNFTNNIKNLVVKVGTSVLTTDGRFDKKVIDRLSAEISKVLKKGLRVSIVSSGAIGAGMTILKMKQRPKTMQELQAAAAVGQRYLMQCYEEAFSKNGFSTAQMLLTWDDRLHKTRWINARHTLRQVQNWGLVPVVNENDTVATDEIRFGDNDRLASLLAILIEADCLVILSDTNGLFDKGRRHQPKHRISSVEKIDQKIFSHVRKCQSSF